MPTTAPPLLAVALISRTDLPRFQVQYKEADRRGSRWKTIDEDIPQHIRSYEVTGLQAGQTYR